MSLTSFLMVAITSIIILFIHLYLIFMECSCVGYLAEIKAVLQLVALA